MWRNTVRKPVGVILLAAASFLLAPTPGAAARELPHVRVLSGRIIDENGRPVPRVTVYIASGHQPLDAAGMPIKDRSSFDSPVRKTRTDDDGRFLTKIMRGSGTSHCPWWCYLLVREEGRVAISGQFCMDEGSLDIGYVRLLPSRRLTVRVTGEEEEAVANARVRLLLDLACDDEDICRPHPVEFCGESDEDGRVRFTGLPPRSSGAYRLKVSHADHAAFDSRLRRPKNGATHVVKLSRGRTVRGRLLDPEGNPAIGHGIEGQAHRSWELARTDEEGRFSIPHFTRDEAVLAVGTRTNDHPVFHPDGAQRPMLVMVDREPDRLETDLGDILIPERRLFSGTVVSDEGTPVEGARVVVESAAHPGVWLGGARTSEGGRFVLDAIDQPGLCAFASGYGYVQGGVRSLALSGESIELNVTRKGTVVLNFVGGRRKGEVVALKVWIDGEPVTAPPWRTRSLRLEASPGEHSIRIIARGKRPRVLEEVEFDPTCERQVEVRLFYR